MKKKIFLLKRRLKTLRKLLKVGLLVIRAAVSILILGIGILVLGEILGTVITDSLMLKIIEKFCDWVAIGSAILIFKNARKKIINIFQK